MHTRVTIAAITPAAHGSSTAWQQAENCRRQGGPPHLSPLPRCRQPGLETTMSGWYGGIVSTVADSLGAVSDSPFRFFFSRYAAALVAMVRALRGWRS